MAALLFEKNGGFFGGVESASFCETRELKIAKASKCWERVMLQGYDSKVLDFVNIYIVNYYSVWFDNKYYLDSDFHTRWTGKTRDASALGA